MTTTPTQTTTPIVDPQQNHQPVRLFPHQERHVAEIGRILEKQFFAIDLSMLGAGKTYTSTKIGELLGVEHVVVVAPVSVGPKWAKMRDDHGLKLDHCLSFAGVRSTKFREPKHGLLTRRDYEVEQQQGGQIIHKVEFKRTPALERMVDEGLLLIIDEIQNIKNISEQFHACRELIRTIGDSFRPIVSGGCSTTRPTNSRVILVSGSPIDKQEQAVHLFRALGIMTKPDLCRWDPGTYTIRSTGFTEIVDHCKALLAPGEDLGVETRFFDHFARQDSSVEDVVRSVRTWRQEFNATGAPIEEWPRYLSERFSTTSVHPAAHQGHHLQQSRLEPISGVACQKRVYALFQGCFKKHTCAAMNTPKKEAVDVVKRNGYFHVPDDMLPLLRKGVTKLADASEDMNSISTVSNAQERRRRMMQVHYAITQAMTMIETAKVSTIARLARQALDADPRARVVVCMNYCETLKDLVAELKDAYAPILMTGNMTARARGKAIDAFQSNDPRKRLLVGNTAVLSTGIDLDDKDGRFPRKVFVSPTYNTITLYQLSHRFLRMDTASSADFFMVYGAQMHETRLLAALDRKSKVMKETTPGQVAAGVVFPCDFEAYYENGAPPR